MLNDSGFEPEDIYYNLKNLSTVGGRKYSKELISLGKNYYRKINKGTWDPITDIKNRNVLIIGPGISATKYKSKIVKSYISINAYILK